MEAPTAPILVSTAPAAGALAVPTSSSITASFNKDMDSTTITSGTFTLRQGGATVAASVSTSGAVATLHPTTVLDASTVYTAQLTVGVKSSQGVALAAPQSWTFTTAALAGAAPTILSTLPTASQTGVPSTTTITALFSQPMDAASLTPAAFTLVCGGAAAPGTVATIGATSVLTPSAPLAPGTTCTATVTTAAKNTQNRALAAAHAWTFTTAGTPPTVSATLPAQAAANVALNTTLQATFTKAMDPTSINGTTFTVTRSGTLVTGAVTYAGLVATFTPSSSLLESSAYSAAISVGAKDASGLALAAPYLWEFSTVGTLPVVVSTNPVNSATGVGVASTVQATFSKEMDAATINATSFTLSGSAGAVAGTVNLSGTTATFTPAVVLPQASLFTATITTAAKDVTGQGLVVAHVWSFNTARPAPLVASHDPLDAQLGVPVAQAVQATFTHAMDPTTLTNTNFTLKRGGEPVLGTVTYAGLVATFTPAAPLTESSQFTASIVAGVRDEDHTAMLADVIWSFTTAGTSPMVTATSPLDAAADVPVLALLTASFSEPMDPATLNSLTFTLMNGAVPVFGIVTYAGTTATFTPTSPLDESAHFTATIAATVTDTASNPLAAAYVWSFNTVGVSPQLVSTQPANLALDWPVDSALTATFNESMDATTLNSATFSLTTGGTPVPGNITCVGAVATFTPSTPLAEGVTYSAAITTGVRDLASNKMLQAQAWSFTTANTAPVVASKSPANGGLGVGVMVAIQATFSEPMSIPTLNSTTFTVKQGATPVFGAVTYAANTVTFTPSSPLLENAVFTATLSTGVKDLAGNAMAAPQVWSFTTAGVPPTVLGNNPAVDAVGSPINSTLSVTFSESMDAATLNTGTFQVKQGAITVTGIVAYAGTTATFSPTAPLAESTLYTVTITTGVKDLASNAMAAPWVWSFTTVGTTPVVVSSIPSDTAVGVMAGTAISATFNVAMDAATFTSSSFTVTAAPGAVPVFGTVSLTGQTATFAPGAALANSTVFTATLTTTIKSSTGLALQANHVWTFTTASGAPAILPVDLKTAANFSILSKAGISTVPPSVITGDIAVSPAAATSITGFSLTLDASTTFATATQVVGKVYAADMTAPTPTTLTTAVGDLEAAFSDAAGRTPGTTELLAGNIGGSTLMPGVYKWTNTVLINSDITLNGSASDVWIFQIAQDLAVANATTIHLTGGALAKNVFWQVSGAVSSGTTSHLEGTVLCATAINLQGGASIQGRLLALTTVAVDSSTVTQPAP